MRSLSLESFRETIVAAAIMAVAAMPASGQSWKTVTASRQLAGESTLDVDVDYAVGRLRVRPADDGLLYHVQLRYDEEVFQPLAAYHSGRLEVGVSSHDRSVRLGRDRSGGEMDLLLGKGVPTDLSMTFGAVRADVDLGGVDLTGLTFTTGASETKFDMSRPNGTLADRVRFEVGAADFSARRLGNLNARLIEVDAGVGQVTLDFGGGWTRDSEVQIRMGLGSLELRFPEGLGVRFRKDSFLTALDSEGMVKRGDAYYSRDWDTAERKVTVDLDAGFGSVRIVWDR